jgi:hypothetical protein
MSNKTNNSVTQLAKGSVRTRTPQMRLTLKAAVRHAVLNPAVHQVHAPAALHPGKSYRQPQDRGGMNTM